MALLELGLLGAMSVQSAVAGPNDLMGILSSDGYGYKVKVLINGNATTIEGGQSESLRLFRRAHEMVKRLPPEMRKRLAILKDGKNQIQVEFTKEGKELETLRVSLELGDYPAPVFLLFSRSKKSGKADTRVALQKVPPENFRPVYVSDEGENRSAFVHVSTMGTTVTPVLNGRQEMTLGMMGSVPLENVQSGKNELVIKYEGNPAEAKELRYAIVTPEWVKFNVRKITDRSEKSETFTFSAP